ncbi:MAG TPA: HRDC domain-containing protein [Geobacterales bacterium]|nr:HRDC domain-containing protein [Geobacterales bacterium]
MSTLPCSYISDQEALKAAVGRMVSEPVIAVDTEGDSLHHYQEKVCLIQMSTPIESFIIDPLAFGNLSPLAPLLADNRIRKVFHGADYDIRSLFRDFGLTVNNLFDTMVACQFLGEKEFGLAAVLKKRFGVELDKKYQKADWSKRPLDEGMIAYAVTDTTLLISLSSQLEKELLAAGRMEWFREECELLSAVRPNERRDEPFFLRFKGAAKLDRRGLAVLEGLLLFRDERARQRDLPPFKILPTDPLRELAEQRPLDAAGLKKIATLPPRLAERYGEELLTIVQGAMSLPEGELPRYPRAERQEKDLAREARLKKLKEFRQKRAEELRMEPGLVINNALLEGVAAAQPASRDELQRLPGVKRWQLELLGEELVRLSTR